MLNYPMDDKHLFFFRNAGFYHHATNVSIAVVTLALIFSAGDSAATGEAHTACGAERIDWAWAMLYCKLVLMIWGVINAGTQLLLTGQCGTSLRTSVIGMSGAASVHVGTVASALRASFQGRISSWLAQAEDAGPLQPLGIGGSE
eukprot:COSAG05_NODE_3096_length_2324_cov_34.303343_3_plen_145_part_00